VLVAYVEFIRTNDRALLRERLDELWNHPDARSLSQKEISSLSLLELRTALSTAQDDWAGAVLTRAGELLSGLADVDVLRAMAHAYHGRNTAARTAIAPIVSGERICSGTNAQIAGWLLEAHLAAANDEPRQASHAVSQAIALAAARRALRNVVTTASIRVRELLLAGQGGFGAHEEFVTQALAAMTRARNRHGLLLFGDALTARELELLRDLPSLLTLDEIAAAHVVSVNTVKSHLKALYRKLEVTSRRAAVERANELGLL
jgi:LuxR family maltose regulon positive regulatory protein